ncbi:hypothetical protein AYK25_00710 [Thermoplasmatales archaeon SM1-50]|nr:MAG: hypothetical protein AYK25_00710 [Thermoplasmatales archaeon SM1-50]
MKYRTYTMFVIMLLIGTLMVSIQAAAHNPRFMKLDYEPETLQVLILHFSLAPKIHYVYKVDIEKNGELYTSESYNSQQRFIFFRYSYNVTATSGDQLTVTAYCSLFGKLTKSLIT